MKFLLLIFLLIPQLLSSQIALDSITADLLVNDGIAIRYYDTKEFQAIFEKINYNGDCFENGNETYCATLNASASVDTAIPNLIFRWELEDGSIEEGLILKRCFDEPGYREVYVGTYDPTTGIETKKDKKIELYFSKKWKFRAEGLRTANEEIAFLITQYSQRYVSNTFVWDLGDGRFKEGSRFNYAYKQAGEYNVRLYVLSEVDDKLKLTDCVYEQITIR